MASKFADKVFAKKDETEFKSKAASETAEDEDNEDAGASKDTEDGKLLQAALKRGDQKAICEAIRRIAGT